MAKHGEVTLDWADGTYSFRLGLGEIEEIETKFDRSIFVIASALGERTARSTEISEILRIGLIGGGMAPPDALAKTRRYVDERPLEENRDTAYAVALAGLLRVHGDEVEEEPPGEVGASGAIQSGSTSGQSGETPS